jgi:ABC-type branched-subunit amino acid transport system substrate-binding protein
MVEKTKNADCVVFFGKANFLVLLSASLKKNGHSIILAPYLLMEENLSMYLSELNDIIILSPGEFMINKNERFVADFKNAYRKQPGAIEAYAFDAINIVIQGIRQSGDRSSLYRNISKINHNGVTGEISFDASGNRKVLPGLIKIYNGKFLKIED